MKDSERPALPQMGKNHQELRRRPISRCVALALLGAAGANVALAIHEGLPFTETFSDDHAADLGATTADWGVAAAGFLTLPTAVPVTGVFDPSAPGIDVGLIAHTTRDLELGDLNGDGLLDLVEASTGRNGVYLNDGGSFPIRVDLTTDTGNSRGVALGDLDRDGDLDVVVANLNQLPRLYLNSGDGVQFTGHTISPNAARSDSIVLEDFNGDGWLDVAVANQALNDSLIYYHTGSRSAPFGVEGVAGTPLDSGDNAQVVLAGDLDNDGDTDIVLVNENNPNYAYINDGEGNFTEIQIGAEADNSQGGALGDLDGDGYLDLVVGNYPPGPGSINRVYFNSGDEAAPFSAATAALNLSQEDDPAYVHHVTLADVDLDGDLDILLSTAGLGAPDPNVTRYTNRLYLNRGDRTFEATVDIGADMDVTNSIVVGDVDGDGLPDVIAGNEDRAPFDEEQSSAAGPAMNRLYRNVGVSSGADPVLQLSGFATSTRIYDEEEPIPSVSLDAVFAPLGVHNRADFWVSSDAGTTWLYIEPGTGPVVFPEGVRGNDLRWRVFLRSLSPSAVGAQALALDSVTISADAPSFTSTPVTDATVDAAYAYDVVAMDATPGDVLTLTAPTLPAWLTFMDNGGGTGTLTGTPAAEDVGDHEVVLEVADQAGTTSTQTFTISVASTGAAPTFDSTPVTAATAGADYEYAIGATDADGDALTLTAPVLPAWLTLTDSGDGSGTGTLTGTPADEDVGEHAVELVVTDASGATATQTFNVTVAAAGEENAAPTFVSTPAVSATAQSAYSYTVETADPDEGDVLTIAASTVPGWLNLTDNGDGTAALAGTPEDGDVGDHAVELIVTDAAGATAAQAFTVTVAPAGGGEENEPPSFVSTPAVAATSGSAYSYTIEASDPDEDDVLTITASTVPTWLTLNDNGDGTATLSGTPAAGNVGNHEVVIQVEDEAGATAEQTFTVAVAAANPNPNPNPTPTPRSSGGGGSAGLFELLGLAFATVWLRLRRRERR